MPANVRNGVFFDQVDRLYTAKLTLFLIPNPHVSRWATLRF
jgi:hypothetical protein